MHITIKVVILSREISTIFDTIIQFPSNKTLHFVYTFDIHNQLFLWFQEIVKFWRIENYHFYGSIIHVHLVPV